MNTKGCVLTTTITIIRFAQHMWLCGQSNAGKMHVVTFFLWA